MSKTFEKASRTDAYMFDPMDLCIIGGKRLPEGERGPLDTEWDPTHSLHQDDLLKPLTEAEVVNIEEMGVLVPIEIMRLNNVPTVVMGRGRVRKARLANARRKANRVPQMELRAVVTRETNRIALLKRMMTENIFRKDVSVLDRIALGKKLLEMGCSEDEAAAQCGVGAQQFSNWLALEDNATPEVRKALEENRIGPSAAMELATVTNPKAQNEALANLMKAPEVTARAAKKEAQRAKGTVVSDKVGKRDLKKLLKSVEPKTKGNEWMQGVAAGLRMALGEKNDARLMKMLEKADDADTEE